MGRWAASLPQAQESLGWRHRHVMRHACPRCVACAWRPHSASGTVPLQATSTSWRSQEGCKERALRLPSQCRTFREC